MLLAQPRCGRASLALIAVIAFMTALPASAARAEKPANSKAGNVARSVTFVPADAAFYASMMRNREQIEAVLHSRAWAKLRSLPSVQMGWQAAMAEINKPGSPMAQFHQFYDVQENKELVALLGDMASDEIFIYGGADFAGTGELLIELMGTARLQRMMVQLMAKPGTDPNKAQARSILDTLAAHPDLLKIPALVIGFRVRNLERAEAQLKRLQELVEAQLSQVPELKGRFKRAKAAGGNFLTLSLDGSLVPWDRIPFEDIEEKPGEYDDLVKKLTALKLTISLGLREDYVLLSLGESTKHLEKLGYGNSLLARDEFKPLKKMAGERLTGISYVSKALRVKVSANKEDIDNLVKMSQDALKKTPLPEALQERLAKDAADLGKDVKQFITEPGAQLAFGFLTTRGVESYAYDWSEHPQVDASKPLTLLNHLGGTPLCAVVERSKYSPEHYHLLVKWLKVAHGYFEDFALPQMRGEQKAKYDEVARWVYPLLKRLDRVTDDTLLPALADGQMALVVDAKIKSTRWFKQMPPSAKPLPMLEFAVVVGVSDAELLRKACAEYRAIANEAIGKVHDMVGDQFIIDKIPAPHTLKVKSGTIYYYPLPKQMPIDPQILPNAGLADKVADLALTQLQSERLLADTPLKTNGGPLADLDRPLAAATFFDWAGTVDALSPWVEYVVEKAGVQRMVGGPGHAEEDDEPSPKGKGKNDVMAQVRTVLEILKVMRGYTSCTYEEQSAVVTHGETVIEDLPAGSD